jgi:pimeloyl-ACP methyl ester carboxylesterase
MKTLLVTTHGIMTDQTTASWPDRLDASAFDRDPEIKVLKKEYRAGPFPRWNCMVKDPYLARSLANELELFLQHPAPPDLWFVAHSNGAVIALLTAKILIERGYKIAGLILTGAACEADLAKNCILGWLEDGNLRAAISYSSADDAVLPFSHSVFDLRHSAPSFFRKCYSALGRPYGSLGRTGWLLNGEPLTALSTLCLRPSTVLTRWYPGGHSTYFTPQNIEATFEQIYHDIQPVGVPVPIKHLLNTEH